MSWIEEYDGIFFISLATILVGALGVSAKYCLRSKCEHFNCCWGLFTVDRRVDLETEEHLRELEMGVNIDEEKADGKQQMDLSHLSKKK